VLGATAYRAAIAACTAASKANRAPGKARRR
jgi:hypothetical protein